MARYNWDSSFFRKRSHRGHANESCLSGPFGLDELELTHYNTSTSHTYDKHSQTSHIRQNKCSTHTFILKVVVITSLDTLHNKT